MINYFEIIKFTESIITIAALSIGAVSAVLGLYTWKKQIKIKYDHDLAREILSLTYTYKNELVTLRIPVQYTINDNQDYRDKSNEKIFHSIKVGEVYSKRFASLDIVQSQLESLVFQAEFSWDEIGNRLSDIYKNLFHLAQISYDSAIEVVTNLKEELKDFDPMLHIKNNYRSDKKFRDKIDLSIREIEMILKSKIIIT